MTDFDFIGAISGVGWRDVVLVVAAVTGVYLVLSVIRLFQVAGKRRAGAKRQARPGPSAWQPDFPIDEPEAAPGAAEAEPEFAQVLARSNHEAELQSLRRECADLREDMARLTEEVARLKATRNVSPLYNEAMTLAQQGMAPAGIAGHCGISIGEAELVAALARGESESTDHQQNEDRDERNTDSGNRRDG